MDWEENSPQSVEEWLAVAERYRGDARVLKNQKRFTSAWNAVGFAIECYLKAAIMRKLGLNRWPSKSERPELWVHETAELLRVLGVTFDGLGKHPVRYRLKTVLDWKRRHGYNPEAIPEKYAEQIYQDAFSSDGVVEWIAKSFHLPC
ncbi:hypothetical protein [Rhizobium laguerreae]|uniref:hypothetical protein n=1 Tax=Rhizobium laguerreae TaxID=1076926 RepID=UPI001A8CFAB1|nr:hypothetical protein [Rhizobium laguerreae]